MTYQDTILRDALREAARAVGGIPPEHNRDQAAAAVCAFLRFLAGHPDAPADVKEGAEEFAADIQAVRDTPDWWPEGGP